MSKGTQNLTLTRERKIALPIILEAARVTLPQLVQGSANYRKLEAALKAFD